MKVFVSYRRRDVGGYAGRLTDALVQRFGGKSVFHDVTAIGPGLDFAAQIDRALNDSHAVLAVIGPGWLGEPSPRGESRVFDPDDYVRLELSKALARGVPVVPVLVGGASLPASTDLPPDLAELVQRQAVVLHDETWHTDVDGLARSLRGEPVARQRSRRWMVVGALLVLLLASAATVWRLDSATGGQAAAEQRPPPCGPTTGWNRVALSDNPRGEVQKAAGQLLFTVESAHSRPRDGAWQVMLRTTMQNDTSGPEYHDYWMYDSLIVAQRRFEPTCFTTTPEVVDSQQIGEAMIGFDIRCEPTGYMELALQDSSGNPRITDAADWGSC